MLVLGRQLQAWDWCQEKQLQKSKLDLAAAGVDRQSQADWCQEEQLQKPGNDPGYLGLWHHLWKIEKFSSEIKIVEILTKIVEIEVLLVSLAIFHYFWPLHNFR